MKSSYKERPILFSAPMVQAILAGSKTQTRRVVKKISADCELFVDAGDGLWQQCYRDDSGAVHSKSWLTKCPFGVKGDRLWVRETWAAPVELDSTPPRDIPKDTPIYPRDWERQVDGHLIGRWRPSIHMPRWASRITLEVTDIRVERLRDIDNNDILREGIRSESCNICVHIGGSGCESCFGVINPFISLWESINGPGSWDENPWVWVISFQRIGG